MISNPLDGNWTLQPRPELVEELRIGTVEGDPAYQFGLVTAVDVDDAGRIYVLDQQAAQVRVFDGDGRHLRSLGKPGGGPGELSAAVVALLVGADELVYVADLGRQRIVAFSAEGAEVGSTPLALTEGIPMRWQSTPEREFAMQVRMMAMPGMPNAGPMRDYVLRRDPATAQADTLLELTSGGTVEVGANTVRIRLFAPEPVWTMLQDGRIVHGTSDVFRVLVVADDGTLDRVITVPSEPRPITEADQAAILELMRDAIAQQVGGQTAAVQEAFQQALAGIEFADYYPAYASLLGGPGNTLWAQRIRKADDAREEGGPFDPQQIGGRDWDVFDAEGRLLGPVTMPDRFTALRVVGDEIYGVQRDELDVQYIVRIRVVGLSPP